MKEIEKLKIEPVRDPEKFDFYTPEDEAHFCALIKEHKAFSLFLYSRNVLTAEGIKWLGGKDKSVRTVARGGVMYAPVTFFRDFLGRAVESDDGFLPLLKTCSELGIFAKTYNDGLLAVVGGKAIDAEIKKNARLIYAGGYATLGKYDASKFTSEDYVLAKKNWRESIVGSAEINDVSIPEVREKIAIAERNYENALAIFHRDPDAVILFGEKPPTDSVDLKTQYDFLESFAVVWAMHGSKYYKNEKILEDVFFGLEWMYSHMYGEAEIEERGWRSARDYDWWHWYVGASEPLTDILFLLGDLVPIPERRRYLRCFLWVVTFMRLGYFQNCATSRIRVCTKAALLLEDAEWLENEFYDYDLLCEVNEEGEGPHIDYINWTHVYPYNFMYGNNNLCRVMLVGALLGGTPLEFTSPKQYNLFKLAKYMFEPILYRGRGAQIFAGRGAGAAEWEWGSTTVAQLLPMIGLFGEDEDNYIKRIIKRNSVIPDVVTAVKSKCQLPELKKYVDIMNDDSIPFDDGYETAHAYFTGDRAVQQRSEYALTVALCSSRHPSYESINGVNKKAWYTGDGAVYLSTKNDDHTFDGVNFAVNEKVMMNVPGTTVDTQKRIPWSHRVGLKGACDFVGSISADEKYALAAMDYKAYDFHGETVPPTDGDYGGGYLKHTNDLSCKKAYFLLDKECLCLGAGITSTTGYPVKTVVECRPLIVSDAQILGTDRAALDGAVLPVSDFEEVTFDAPHYASLEGVGGYVFLDAPTVSAEKFSETECHSYKDGERIGTRKYESAKRFFKLCIEHGANPTNASYAYATLPYATDGQLEDYARSPEVEIISNTKDCQAVRKKSIGISSYVFYTAGKCEEISVSEPCMVVVSENGGEYKISVCDPTMKLQSIKLTLDKRLKPKTSDGAVSVKTGEKTELEINVTHSVGRPYTARFKLN